MAGPRSSVGGRQSRVARLSESEVLAVAALMFAAAVMVAAWFADSIRLPIQPAAVLGAAVLLTTIAVVLVVRGGVSFSTGRFAAFAAIVLGFTAYICWLAWPSLLPITHGPDLVHHLTLIHFIQRRHTLPHDAALGAYLGEMVGYTPGSHLLAALVAEWLRVDPIRLVHALQALAVGVKAGLVFCGLMRLMRSSTGAAVAAAVAGTLLLLLPHRYLLEPLTLYGFYSQVIAETFAVGVLWTLIAWHQRPSRIALAVAAVCGVGVTLSWPVYLPAPALALVSVVTFRWWVGARTFAAVVSDVLIALLPAAVVMAALSLRHAGSTDILRSGGSVIVPGADVFGWAFLLLTAGGFALAVRRWRARLPLLAFASACTLQIAALAIAQASLGATNLYLANKSVFLLVYPMTVLAALALATVTRPFRVPYARVARHFSAATGALAVAGVLLFRGLPIRPIPSPISEPVYEAGLWAKAHVRTSCVDYIVENWVTGYWLHLDVLGNPRVSERMRTETFESRRAIGRWILPGGPAFAIVEDLAAVPVDARATMHVLHASGPAAVVKRTDGGVCPTPP